MPPPTSVDSWLTARRFGIVIDAGSSGSRLQIYSWKDARAMQGAGIALDTLPKVEKGTLDSEEWSMKVEPGISSFADNLEGVSGYLAPLLEHARTVIPPSLEPETPLFLLATAGMRLLNPTQQAEVLQATCHFLRFHSNFRIDDMSPAGPCGSSVRVITGEAEGLFGWIAVNYLMDGFSASGSELPTYGFLDMGGASTQIAFEPSKEAQENAQNLADVRLRLLNGEEIIHKVFVTTWLGYGTNLARERYVGQTLSEYDSNRTSSSTQDRIILDPCLPRDLQLTESPAHLDSSNAPSKIQPTLVGTGSFEQCLERTLPLLNKEAPCPDENCLFDGVYVPPIDFSASNFIGVSEYWYSSEHIFGLGGAYDVVQFERAASEFCARNWDDIVRHHESSQQQGKLGGAGEIQVHGEFAGAGVWGNKVNISRLQMQCFKAAWIVNVLHEGIGLPRIIDAGGNSSTNGDKVAEQAATKGLGRPAFQSMDTVGDIAISWTLGKMVLEASKEVTPFSASVPPLIDPLSNSPSVVNSPSKSHLPSFLDFEAIEDRISHRLPISLTRQSLGFSPVATLFYLTVIAVCLAVMYRLRHRVRSAVRRIIYRKDRGYTLEGYAMEEGRALNGGSQLRMSRSSSLLRISSQILQPLKTLSSSLGSRNHHPPSIGITVTSRHPTRSGQYSPSRVSPLRSLSYPPQKPPLLSPIDAPNGTATAFVPGSPRLQDGSIVSNGSLASLTSRSRNSSQVNLAVLTPRQTISRASSGAYRLSDRFWNEA
ncbi:Golgi apyrase [Sparassis crispa]|uniref:Golgi apyrase n=1 Tax=Sparassis crispa TaxID=139825 RepID=A0A401GI34_9APHY|nr:Golgi apyrase [Sparassis crispa]GBE81864.1 Golgi apyrase [Sparassis crispa]